jgi:hypothetical protein
LTRFVLFFNLFIALLKMFNFFHIQFCSILIPDMLGYFLAILKKIYPMSPIFYLNMPNLVTLTFDLHQRSLHEKDALVLEDHFPVEFLKISQLESKILALLVRRRGNLPKILYPYRTHPLLNIELNFLLVNVINIGNNSTKFHKNL